MTPARRVRAYLLFYIAFTTLLVAMHWPLLDLPYYWDELGQFVPSSLDILEKGAWIPESALPNAHPPAVMAWLALVWRVVGYSVVATRVAMLLVAGLGLLAVFLLAIRLCRGTAGAPALIPVVVLACSPLFFAQSMLAQLDMPAMVFTAIALLLFLQERHAWAVAACVLLALVKETGLATAGVLILVLAWERRFKLAAWYLLPFVLVGGWLLLLKATTGLMLGNQVFTDYNLHYPMHPMRLVLAVFRRLWFFLVENFHWVGAIAVVAAWRRHNIFATRDWRIAGAVFAGNVLGVTVLGGAVLERYLLPALPLFYIAIAAALSTFSAWRRNVAAGVMSAGMLVSLYWNPPYPFPYENNLAFTDFVELQKTAAEFLERNYEGKLVASAWPLPDALRRPEFGYVKRPTRVKKIEDLSAASVRSLRAENVDLLVMYSRMWEPRWSVLRFAWTRSLLEKFYQYQPQATGTEIARELGLVPVARWERRGQWIEVYGRAGDGYVITL